MVARWILVVVCLSGCDQLFGLVHVDDQPDASGACPASYDIMFAESTTQYRYVADNTTWDGAEESCANHTNINTHLVVLTDDNERLPLAAALKARLVTTSVWIGLSDRKVEGEFLWVTREQVGMPPIQMPPWSAGQPDNQGGTQHCVRMYGTDAAGGAATLFDDGECGVPLDYVCECDAWAPEPMNF